MDPQMPDAHLPILHHFEASPFSEKIRVIFGFKRMAWQSVLIPRIMPKPDLMPLTGGYRRTPVMQIGADIYCDTKIIARSIEARFPEPALLPPSAEGLPWMVGMWTDRSFFETTVKLVFGSLGDKVPESFIEDRSKLRGERFDVKAMAAALPQHRTQFCAQAALIEAQLREGRPWLLDSFSLVDVNCYMNIWYVRSNLTELADELLAQFPRLRDWESRIKSLGHGTRTDISAQESHAIAAKSSPDAKSLPAPHQPGTYAAGQRVVVVADEPVKTPVEGEIVFVSTDHIAIRRHDPSLGELVVHFPRIGYSIAAV
jgi:glutathione S-transferase